jgi:hypothetical protein
VRSLQKLGIPVLFAQVSELVLWGSRSFHTLANLREVLNVFSAEALEGFDLRTSTYLEVR